MERSCREVHMSFADVPLTRDRIVSAAEDVLRRFGPAKAPVVDVARALGVSHAAVYRHVATKAELRDLVVGRWAETTMPPLRAIADKLGPAPERLRQLFDALIAVKRRRAAEDPELFAAYRTLAADAQSVVAAHIGELIGLAATDRKSTRLNSSHLGISYAVFCLKKKKKLR